MRPAFPLVAGVLVVFLLILLITIQAATLLYTWSLSKDNTELQHEVTRLDSRLEAATVALEDTKKEGWLKVRYRSITLGKTGNEVCGEEGEVCVAVEPTEAHAIGHSREDKNNDGIKDSFWGWSTFDCNSRITHTSSCGTEKDGTKYPYKLDRQEFRKSPKSKITDSSASGFLCLREPSYNHVICAVPSTVAP